MFRWIFTVLITVLLAGCSVQQQEAARPSKTDPVAVPVTQVSANTVKLEFPSERYPETAKHIKEAIASGKSPVCTIDRDEWPMAMCSEGGEGADIKYISPKDNRGAGSWVGHKLDEYEDGTKVEFIVN